jgi:uncharacterized LabA/DUF88 family protein
MPNVIVFIDAQNAYMTARDAFGWSGEIGRFGSYRPLLLGRVLAAGRDLKQVRIYTGVPSNEKDKTGYQANQRRIASWKAEGSGLVEVFERTLKYAPRQPPREKGVDVLLAVDLVRLALEDEGFDVAVLLSGDTDLVPAVEFVVDHKGSTSIESAMWEPLPNCECAEPLGVSTEAGRPQIARRKVTYDEFMRAADKRNFNKPYEPPAPAPGQSGRRIPNNRRR